MPAQNIPRPKLSELVIAGIKEHILRHGLAPGDRLPTEQQMAELFGVSRVSVREATKALSFLGIIDSAPRRGLTVGRVDMHKVTEYLGFLFALSDYPLEQLLRTRIVLETGAIEEAAGRLARDPAALARLSSLNDRIEDARSADAFIDADVAFHRALIEASGIEPLLAFSDLLEVFFRRARTRVLAQWRRGAGAGSHQAIFDAIRRGDACRAQAELRKHLAYHLERTPSSSRSPRTRGKR